MTAINQRMNRGFLSAGAIRAGARDQWALLLGRGKVIVELYYDQDLGTYIVDERVHTGDDAWSNSYSHHIADDARAQFQRLIKKHS